MSLVIFYYAIYCPLGLAIHMASSVHSPKFIGKTAFLAMPVIGNRLKGLSVFQNPAITANNGFSYEP